MAIVTKPGVGLTLEEMLILLRVSNKAKDMERDLWKTFWKRELLAPVPFLADLRSAVIARSEKRLPKWRFRLAPDLVMQLQPKVSEKVALRFEGLAAMSDDADIKLLESPQGRELDWCHLKFEIFSVNPAEWIFQPLNLRRKRRGDSTVCIALRDRVVAEFHSGRFNRFTPDMMLRPACLSCGKALTDPASMSRWIGPECYGSASVAMPWMLKLSAGEQVMEAEERMTTQARG